jgi:hypothetical protein
MRWVGHVARTGEQCTRLWWEGLKERDHLEDQGIHGRMGSERLAGSRGVEWIQLAQVRDWVASPCVCSDEPLGSGATELVFNCKGYVLSNGSLFVNDEFETMWKWPILKYCPIIFL